MIKKAFFKMAIIVVIAATSLHANATKKRVDEPSGGASGGGSGTAVPSGGTQSPAGAAATQAVNAKITKEANGVARTTSKTKDEKVQNSNAK